MAAGDRRVCRGASCGGHAVCGDLLCAEARLSRHRHRQAKSGRAARLLKGDFDLIAARLKARKGHFMPPALLQSQFDALEEPARDEHAITVSIGATPEEIAGKVAKRLQRERA